MNTHTLRSMRGLGQGATYSSGAAAICTTDATGLQTCVPGGQPSGTSTILYGGGQGAMTPSELSQYGTLAVSGAAPLPQSTLDTATAASASNVAAPLDNSGTSCGLGTDSVSAWLCANWALLAGAAILLVLLEKRR